MKKRSVQKKFCTNNGIRTFHYLGFKYQILTGFFYRNIFDSLIKFHGTSHISAVNLIVATGSLCNIAKLRKNLLQPVVEAIGSLLNRLPPTLTSSQVNSVKKHIRIQLFNILKATDATDIQTIIVQHLQHLGCTLDEIKRIIPKKDKYSNQKIKRADEFTQLPPSKRHCKENDQQEKHNDLVFCNKLQKKSLYDKISNINIVIELIALGLQCLPNKCPSVTGENLPTFLDISSAKKVVTDIIWREKHKVSNIPIPAITKHVEEIEAITSKKPLYLSSKLKETLDRMKE